MKHLVIPLSSLFLVSLAVAGTIANGDFESGLSSWQAASQGGAQVTVSNDKPAAGKGCLQLSCTGSDQGWALGPALPGQPGDLLQLSFSARRGQGKATLLMTLVADTVGLAGAPVWEGVLPADNNWHKVSLLLAVPPLPGGGVPRLAFGVVGLAGSWAVDAVDAVPGQPLTMAPTPMTGELMDTETLPEGWQPEGNLDARTKEIAGKTELLLDVNGIEVGLLPEFTCQRGLREGMVLYAVNRGEVDKRLLVRIAAPTGIESPGWIVPVRGKSNAPDDRAWAGTTRFHTTLECLRRGTFWVKLIVKSANEEKAAPIKVTCREQYPAVGLAWRDSVNPAALAAARRAGMDVHLLTAAPDLAAFGPMAEALQGQGEMLVGPLVQSLNPLQYPAAVSKLYAELPATLWAAAPDDVVGNTLAVLPKLVADLHQARPEAYLISPPVTLVRDWQKHALLPSKPANVTTERLAGVVSLAARPPVQASPCVLQQSVDGSADVVSGALVAAGNQTDLGGLRDLLGQRKLSLPMLVGPLQTLPGSDERLAALLLARAMTNAVAEGATGVLLDPAAAATNGWGLTPPQPHAEETPVQQVVRLLGCELDGATPLVPLADSPGIASDPDAQVCYKSFLRGAEGAVVLWNNTGVAKDVSVEFRFEPVVWHRLVFSYQGDFAARRWDPIMQFPAEAFKRRQPAIYLHLDPLQVQVHSFRLLTPHPAWLRKVDFTQPIKPAAGSEVAPREERPWWRDMLYNRSNR